MSVNVLRLEAEQLFDDFNHLASRVLFIMSALDFQCNKLNK